MTTIKKLIGFQTQILKERGIENPRLDVEVLLANILNCSREHLLLKANDEFVPEQTKILEQLVSKRAEGEPVAYLVGKKSFFGKDLLVRPGVLIPRPESEHLVEEALQWMAQSTPPFKICDLGCGSGCIGLSILTNSVDSELLAVDKSPIACEVTRDNTKILGLTSRAEIRQMDLDSHELPGSNFDLVVANPPYVSVGDPHLQSEVIRYEPHEALFASREGLDFILKWKDVSSKILRPGGLLLMEFGATQGRQVLSYFTSDPAFEQVRIGKDLSGHDRYVVAIRSAQSAAN